MIPIPKGKNTGIEWNQAKAILNSIWANIKSFVSMYSIKTCCGEMWTPQGLNGPTYIELPMKQPLWLLSWAVLNLLFAASLKCFTFLLFPVFWGLQLTFNLILTTSCTVFSWEPTLPYRPFADISVEALDPTILAFCTPVKLEQYGQCKDLEQ